MYGQSGTYIIKEQFAYSYIKYNIYMQYLKEKRKKKKNLIRIGLVQRTENMKIKEKMKQAFLLENAPLTLCRIQKG